jgi:insecticidal toxin complex protein TccC
MPLTSAISSFTQTPMISVQDNRGLGVRTLQYNVTPAAVVSRSITVSATPEQRLARTVYDLLGRAESALDERVSERFIYAEASADSQALNLCGQCTGHYDTAGLNARQSMTITGHPLEQQRTLLADVTSAADWAGEDPEDWAALLGATAYVTAWRWDATGNMLGQTDAKGNIQRLSYSVDGQLAASWLTLDGQTEQPIITSLSYSAAGQKLQEVGGNGVITDYRYEPQTQRLLGITTTRPESSGVTAATLQSLNYGYDPVGNILTVSNDSEATRFYRNQKVTPESTYAYDALYQLISASGRESSTNTNQSPSLSALITPIPTDSTQYVNYTRSYTYDCGGNLTQISHNGASQYTTAITVSDTSNHAVQAVSGLTASDVESQFDANGNQNALQSGSPALAWTLRNELQQVTPVVRGGDDDDKEIYLYDGGNMRIVKQTTQLTGSTTQTQTVIYLPGLELRTTNNGTTDTEVLQVVTVGEAGRAQVRVLHWDSGEPNGITGDVLRYSYGDQIGSCQLELDSTGQVISQEEYYPYGGTALWAARSSTEADYKTRRYSGKERDATGLYYYGYRYYQPWIGRWLSADPAGTVDGLNLYRMVRNNPMKYLDHNGLNPVHPAYKRLEEYLPEIIERSNKYVSGALDALELTEKKFFSKNLDTPEKSKRIVKELMGSDSVESINELRTAFKTILTGLERLRPEHIKIVEKLQQGNSDALAYTSKDKATRNKFMFGNNIGNYITISAIQTGNMHIDDIVNIIIHEVSHIAIDSKDEAYAEYIENKERGKFKSMSLLNLRLHAKDKGNNPLQNAESLARTAALLFYSTSNNPEDQLLFKEYKKSGMLANIAYNKLTTSEYNRIPSPDLRSQDRKKFNTMH